MSEAGPQKSERLINLTMALLASRRFLSKAEIFTHVEGYSGSPETMERMFERDKNDLRDLGLEIEVGSEDPLFEDEAGYRIRPESYSLDIGEIDSAEYALISLATSTWQNSLLSKSGQRAIRKIESLKVAGENYDLALPFIRAEIPGEHFELLWQAIENRQIVSFTYHSLKDSFRKIAPYGLGLRRGFWYLVGLDLEKNELRNFKVKRIDVDLNAEKKKDAFLRPADFNITAAFLNNDAISEAGSEKQEASLHLRIGKAQELRAIAQISLLNEDWDLAKISYSSSHELFELVAKAGTSAIIVEPKSLQTDFISWIGEKHHG